MPETFYEAWALYETGHGIMLCRWMIRVTGHGWHDVQTFFAENRTAGKMLFAIRMERKFDIDLGIRNPYAFRMDAKQNRLTCPYCGRVIRLMVNTTTLEDYLIVAEHHLATGAD